LENYEEGIYIDGASGVDIMNCYANHNRDGIILEDSSSIFINNTYSNNNIDYGIYLDNTRYSTINGTNCILNDNGLYIFDSTDNVVTYSNCSLNDLAGFGLEDDSNNNNISYCKGWANDYAVLIKESEECAFYKNEFFRCGFYFDAWSLSEWNSHYIDISNKINYKPVHYVVNQTNLDLIGDVGQILIVNSSFISIDNQDFLNAMPQLGYSDKNELSNLTNDDGRFPLEIYRSHMNNFTDSNFESNSAVMDFWQSNYNNLTNISIIGGSDNINFYNSNFNNVTNCNSSYGQNGYVSWDSDYNTYTNCTAYSNNDGFRLQNALYTDLIDCLSHRNGENGYYFSTFHRAVIQNSTAYDNNKDGFYAWVSTKNKYIECNSINNNLNGFQFEKTELNSIIKSVSINNSVGLLIEERVGPSENNSIIDSEFYDNNYGIIIDFSEYNSIKNCSIIGNSNAGIQIDGSVNSTIIDSYFTSNGQACDLDRSKNSSIENCTFERNNIGIHGYELQKTRILDSTFNDNGHGCYQRYADNLTLQDLTISNHDVGSQIRQSKNVLIMNSNFPDNNLSLYLWDNTENIEILQNNITNNAFSGMTIRDSDGSIVSQNRIRDNIQYGIEITGGSDNSIYLNHFQNNNGGNKQGYDDGTNNNWNIQGIGNYWDDWTTPDNDFDNIVDIPYSLDGSANAKDQFPLTSTPFSSNIVIEDIVNSTPYEDIPYEVQFLTSGTFVPLSIQNWEFNTNASWLSFDNLLKRASGTPSNSDVGTYWIDLSANDGFSEDQKNFSIEVINVNDPPQLISTIGDISFNEDTIFSEINLSLIFSDDDVNDILEFSYEGNDNISIQIFENGSVELNPSQNWSGVEYLKFFADDSRVLTEATTNVMVMPINDPPVNKNFTIEIWVSNPNNVPSR